VVYVDDVLVSEKLVKKFGGVVALDGVDVEVRSGEVAVLLGPNGSGKSTFLKISAGVVEPTSGRLLVFGREPYRDVEVRGRTSYMPQDAGLYSSLTGFENYLFYAAMQEVDRGRALEILEMVKDELELDEWFFKRKVGTYSGGMKRKTSLAVALGSDPDLLILDEPTTGLDPASRRVFWRLIERLKRTGKTVVLATHLFEDAEYLADSIVVMYRGRVVARGSPEELKRKTGYRYAVDVELSSEPSKALIEKLKLPGTKMIPSGGFRLTIIGNSIDFVSEVEERLRSVRVVSFSMRRLSLGDAYFLFTGVRLE